MRTQASVGAVTGTGWTQRVNTAVLTNMTIHVQDKNVAASSAVTGVWDLDNVAGDTMAIVGVFKEPAGGGGTAKHLTLLGVG